MFHLANYTDVADAFRRLKFLKNNATVFDEGYILPALVVTQFQFWASFLSEASNLVFMTRQAALTDIIMNYLAFAGISEIDNIYANAMRYMKVKHELIDDVKPGEQEYLDNCLKYKKEKTKDEADRSTFADPKPSSKSGLMKVIIVVYQIERVLYKAIYFYLFPYVVVFLSYGLYNHDSS